jgi:hypothetical protein
MAVEDKFMPKKTLFLVHYVPASLVDAASEVQLRARRTRMFRSRREASEFILELWKGGGKRFLSEEEVHVVDGIFIRSAPPF